MTRPLVLIFSPIRHAWSAYKNLSLVARTEVVESKSREEFFTDVRDKYKDAFAIYRTSSSGLIAGLFDQEFIDRLPSSMKYICHTGAGYDQIDVNACSRKGITVTYGPSPVTDATADLTFWLILGAMRQLNPSIVSLRNGNFKKGLAHGHDPQGKTLGILGMGRIGRAVKKRADVFGFRTMYHNRTSLPDSMADGATFVSFEELLGESDVLSVHVPFRPDTRHLLGAAELSKMKEGAILINTARGQIVDEAELAAALDRGHLGGVGLDVYEQEPRIHPRLVENQRALLVPHMGTHTVETLSKMEGLALENVRRAVCGEALLTIVPEQSPATRE